MKASKELSEVESAGVVNFGSRKVYEFLRFPGLMLVAMNVGVSVCVFVYLLFVTVYISLCI